MYTASEAPTRTKPPKLTEWIAKDRRSGRQVLVFGDTWEQVGRIAMARLRVTSLDHVEIRPHEPPHL